MAMLTRAARRLLPACSLLLAAAASRRRTTCSKVHGIFINYIDHDRPHLFAHPSPNSSDSSRRPIVDAMFDFLPGDRDLRWWWSVLDHSNGLLLCEMAQMGRGELCVRRWLESEWPPTPWRLDVFSSRTGQWEERAFVRQGHPAGTVRDLLADRARTFGWGNRQRYAVYCRGALYVHCQGSFVLRLSLSNGTYQVIRAPTYKESKRCVTPYLGRSQNMVYFGTVEEPQRLRVWVLAESNGRMEWILKYREDLVPLAQHLTKYGRPIDAPWMVHDVSNPEEDVPAKTLTKRRFEWDSDDDDFF